MYDIDEPVKTDFSSHMLTTQSFCYDCQSFFPNDVKRCFQDMVLRKDSYIDSYRLSKHAKSHMPRGEECHGCDEKSKSPSGILIDLESTACPSDVFSFGEGRSSVAFGNGFLRRVGMTSPLPAQNVESRACVDKDERNSTNEP
jgi:hypothetical protein